jgi:hypothetical protein
MKSDVLWDISACGSCKKRRFGETDRFQHQSEKIGKLGTT